MEIADKRAFVVNVSGTSKNPRFNGFHRDSAVALYPDVGDNVLLSPGGKGQAEKRQHPYQRAAKNSKGRTCPGSEFGKSNFLGAGIRKGAPTLRYCRAFLMKAKNLYYLKLWEYGKRPLYGRALRSVQNQPLSLYSFVKLCSVFGSWLN